jgi:hypothetical protein
MLLGAEQTIETDAVSAEPNFLVVLGGGFIEHVPK